ncbi:MAG: START domain-containing protein, partial [Pseudomonadota bacterium]
MKRYLFSFLFFSTSLSVANEDVAKQGWESAKQESGIEIFTRTVPGSKLKAFKGMLVIDAPQEKLMNIVKNVDTYADWVPDVLETKLLEQTDEYQVHYLKLNAPWPVKNRDGVYRFDYRAADDTPQTVEFVISAIPEMIPEQKNTIRVPAVSGKW